MNTLKNEHEPSGFVDTVFIWASSQLYKPMFGLWYHVMKHIKNIFLLIRSFRETNINLLIVVLEEMFSLFFGLHHVSYNRWVSVFMKDLKDQPLKLPSLYEKFKKGFCVVNTRGKANNSKILMGNAHEHNKKNIKSKFCCMDLVQKINDWYLQKLVVCWPEVHNSLTNVESSPMALGHKENSPAFNSKFINQCNKFHQKIVTNSSHSFEFCKLNSTFILFDVTAEDVSVVSKVKTNQFNNFIKSRFIYGKNSLESKFSKNPTEAS